MKSALKYILFFILIAIQFSTLKCTDWKYYYEKALEYQNKLVSGSLIFQEILDSSFANIQLAENFAKTELNESDTNYINILSTLAVVKTQQKNYNDALQIFFKILNLDNSIYSFDDDMIIRDFDNIAVAYFNLNMFDSTVKYFQKALNLRINKYPENHPQLAIGINNVAFIKRFQGKLREAAELYKEVVRIRRINVKKEDFTLSAPINSLAIVLSDIGEFTQSEKYYLEAISIERRLNNNIDGRLASFLNNIALMYKKQQRYTEAELYLLESYELKKKYLPNVKWQKSNSLNELADLYLKMGRYTQAEDYFLQALVCRREEFLGDNNYIANTLNDLAELYLETGRIEEAQKYYIEALEMKKRVFNNIHPSIAEVYSNLGKLEISRGNYVSANNYIDSAMEMYSKHFPERKLEYAQCQNESAKIAYFNSEFTKAESILEQVLKTQKSIYRGDNFEIAETIFCLAEIDSKIGNSESTLKLYAQSLKIMKEVYSTQSKYLSETEREKFLAKVYKYIDKYSDYAINELKSEQSLQLVYDNHIFLKKIILNTSIKVRNLIYNSNDSALISNYEKFLFINEQLAGNYINKNSSDKLIDSLENEANNLEKTLNLLSSEFAKLNEDENIDCQTIINNLRNNEYSVEILKHSSNTSEMYYAIILSKDYGLKLIKIGTANELEGVSFDNYISNIKHKMYDYLSYNIFWRPINKVLKNPKKIYFSPEGIYYKLNILTLLNPKTEKFILEENDIEIVNSGRDINRKILTANNTNNNSIELFANPKFDFKDSKESISNNIEYSSKQLDNKLLTSIERSQFDNLDFADKEIEIINTIIKSKNPEAVINAHSKAEATEENIKSLKNPKILHIATHGKYFDSENDTLFCHQNHLQNSVLFFAGAENTIENIKNNISVSSSNDGILSAYEAQNLHLYGTELTVLSACETGIGELKNNEGSYSMQRAFLLAGSDAVISSLWKVNDQTTQEFMTILYSNLFEGKSKFQAYKAACLQIREKYEQPYYWGAFILMMK